MPSPQPAGPLGLSLAQRQVISFVERDYEVNQEAATGAHGAVVASRSVGFTLVAALLGFGLSQKSWPLLLLATFGAFAVYLIDAFYSWRASERDAYVRQLEEILAAHVALMVRSPRNQRELGRLERRLAGLRVGSTSQVRTFRARDVRFIQPGPLFKFLYPVLLLFALGACAYFGVRDLRSDADPRTRHPHAVLVREPRARPSRRPVGPSRPEWHPEPRVRPVVAGP